MIRLMSWAAASSMPLAEKTPFRVLLCVIAVLLWQKLRESDSCGGGVVRPFEGSEF